jgi:hypothetical protein
MVTTLVWAEIDSERYGRIFGALTRAECPARGVAAGPRTSAPERTVHRLRLGRASGNAVELKVEAPDRASAAAKAIRQLERDGQHVLHLEFADTALRVTRSSAGDGSAAGAPAARAYLDGATTRSSTD